MSCSHPLLAVYQGVREDGKKSVKILTRIDDVNSVEEAKLKYEKFGHRLMLLPCGKCPGCLKARRKQWAVRCQMESTYHIDNCFVTLTYDDEHCPKSLVKKDLQSFIKSLRNDGLKFRYFGCGEYGSKTHRPHYHLIIFGYMPSDLKPSHKSDAGFWCYTSKCLSNHWSKGLVVINEFTPETAAYVAGYVDKKLLHVDDSFILMSTRPGIGRQYVEEHLGHIYKYDKIVINYGSHMLGVPRYFDKVAEQKGLYIEDIKESRVLASDISTSKAMRDAGITDFNSYFARVLENELESFKRRKRGL